MRFIEIYTGEGVVADKTFFIGCILDGIASRTLFKGREDSLRIASKLTREGKWDEAYKIWEELSGSKDSTTVSKALHNMAVFHELEDDLDSASLLIDMALQYDSLDAVNEYRDEMDVRLLNRKEVIEQVY